MLIVDYADFPNDDMDLENYDLEISLEPDIKFKESVLICGSFKTKDFKNLPPLGQYKNVYFYSKEPETEIEDVPELLVSDIRRSKKSKRKNESSVKQNYKLDNYIYYPKRTKKTSPKSKNKIRQKKGCGNCFIT